MVLVVVVVVVVPLLVPVVPILVVLPALVPGVLPVVLPLVVVLPAVVPVLLAVVVVLPTPTVVLVDPVVVELVLNDAVCVKPFANLVVALADVILPLASKVYCAVPVPGPHAVSMTATPVKVVTDSARMTVTSNDAFDIKVLLRKLSDLKQEIACKCLCQSIALREEFRTETKKFS